MGATGVTGVGFAGIGDGLVCWGASDAAETLAVNINSLFIEREFQTSDGYKQFLFNTCINNPLICFDCYNNDGYKYEFLFLFDSMEITTFIHLTKLYPNYIQGHHMLELIQRT